MTACIRPAGYRYSLYEFLEDFERVYDDIRGRGKPVIMCGGTGMYVETVVKGIKLPPVPRNEQLRAELAGKSLEELTALLKTMKTLRNNSDIDTVARATRAIEICRYYELHPELKALTEPHPMENALVIGVEVDRDTRRERISRRLRARLDEGMIDEVPADRGGNVPPARNRHPPVRQAPDDLVPRHGKTRYPHPLALQHPHPRRLHRPSPRPRRQDAHIAHAKALRR